MGCQVSSICTDEGDGRLEPIHRIDLLFYCNCEERSRAKRYIVVPPYGQFTDCVCIGCGIHFSRLDGDHHNDLQPHSAPSM
jgi:hypothetical protein